MIRMFPYNNINNVMKNIRPPFSILDNRHHICLTWLDKVPVIFLNKFPKEPNPPVLIPLGEHDLFCHVVSSTDLELFFLNIKGENGKKSELFLVLYPLEEEVLI